MSKMTRKEKQQPIVEYNRFTVTYNAELDCYVVTYLKEYEVFIEAQIVEAIHCESKVKVKTELIAMILATTKIIRNLTPENNKPVDDGFILATICELLEAKISPMEIIIQFFYNFNWEIIKEILENPEKAVELYQHYKK